MKTRDALDILTRFQEWRLGAEIEYPIVPKELTQAIDMAIGALNNSSVLEARAEMVKTKLGGLSLS